MNSLLELADLKTRARHKYFKECIHNKLFPVYVVCDLDEIPQRYLAHLLSHSLTAKKVLNYSRFQSWNVSHFIFEVRPHLNPGQICFKVFGQSSLEVVDVFLDESRLE